MEDRMRYFTDAYMWYKVDDKVRTVYRVWSETISGTKPYTVPRLFSEAESDEIKEYYREVPDTCLILLRYAP
jgi:hypothetical protein